MDLRMLLTEFENEAAKMVTVAPALSMAVTTSRVLHDEAQHLAGDRRRVHLGRR